MLGNLAKRRMHCRVLLSDEVTLLIGAECQRRGGHVGVCLVSTDC